MHTSQHMSPQFPCVYITTVHVLTYMYMYVCIFSTDTYIRAYTCTIIQCTVYMYSAGYSSKHCSLQIYSSTKSYSSLNSLHSSPFNVYTCTYIKLCTYIYAHVYLHVHKVCTCDNITVSPPPGLFRAVLHHSTCLLAFSFMWYV